MYKIQASRFLITARSAQGNNKLVTEEHTLSATSEYHATDNKKKKKNIKYQNIKIFITGSLSGLNSLWIHK